MSHLVINGTRIEYEEAQRYISFGVVGSGHGGSIQDFYRLNPRTRLGHKARRERSPEAFQEDVKTELRDVRDLLRTGIHRGSSNHGKKISPTDRYALQNAQNLLSKVVSALEKN